MKKVGVFAVIALLLRFAYKKYTFAKNVTFEFVDIGLQPNLPFSKLAITIRIINPTNTTVNVSSLNLAIRLNSKPIGTANSPTLIAIAPNSETEYTVYAFLNSFATVAAVLNALRTQGAMFNFNGSIVADHLLLPINYVYEI